MVVLREGICPGMNEDFLKALQNKDIRTGVLVAVRRVLLAQYTAFPVSGAELYEELLNSTAILSTGIPSLDKLMDSGLYTGEITELAGSPGSGKTQVCFSVAVNTAHQLKQTVVYIDTRGGMCSHRLQQMLQNKTSTIEEQMEALQKIKVVRIFNVFSLLSHLQNMRRKGLQKISVGGGSVKVVMVDSVSAVLSSMLGGKQNEGMSLLMQVAAELKMLAKDFNLAVLVTNHVTKDEKGQPKAGLGQSWSHVPSTRMLLQRVKNEESSSLRTATLTKSSRQACHLMQQFDLSQLSEEVTTPISGKRKLENQ
ncbi:hypothetical protein DNTS_031823 [Danionella cerebrum]|uniref:DNA repair protein RAD51 homolog 4 n=1 Tax=Danionella cerebrum TaxID=2873325 RepID=A0A553NAE5_9TELE|nr:hypothetical protein DNTS_031823 [Danionella translucida]TRY62411.1 hypothetical protein DNTS_031823 [Danionella translucida]TRY62412.1 hypothetical protein DNTS_031823 [Danionella translucida]